MKSPERAPRFESSENGQPKSDRHGWPPKSFSPDDIAARRDQWEAESGRIGEELNWETDDDVLAIFSRTNQRVEQLGDQYTYEQHLLVMQEETDRFVTEHPDKAQEYKNQWEQWARVAGVDQNISDAEWQQLVLMQPSVSYMGQYRSIARALQRQE